MEISLTFKIVACEFSIASLKARRQYQVHCSTMEEIPVIIVGAGPAGLALGLSLAKYEIYVRQSPLDTFLLDNF